MKTFRHQTGTDFCIVPSNIEAQIYNISIVRENRDKDITATRLDGTTWYGHLKNDLDDYEDFSEIANEINQYLGHK